LLVSPVLAAVWIAGLVALARDRRMRQFRLFVIAWLLLAVIFLASGGKPYYLAGTFPMLLGAGAIQTDRWLEGDTRTLRLGALWGAVALSAVVSAVIALPLLPEKQLGPVLAVNGDVGETIGWPQLVRSVAVAFRRAGSGAVIFTRNYGEAGAVDRFGPALGLPAAYSGHNGFAEWGPPPDRPGSVVAVGLSGPDLDTHFSGCRLVARIGNAADVSNDERNEPISICAGTRGAWSRIWRSLRHLG
jgi:hypothetical protein